MTKTTYKQLQDVTWGAANILRGSVDSGDYKNYILGFFFLKRISDVFEEEALKIEARTGDKNLAWNDRDEHQFFVPEDARWSRFTAVTEDIGNTLNRACGLLEEYNPTLEGVLLSIDYNTNMLGDAKQRDRIFAKLIIHFSSVSMKNEDLEHPDLIGSVYEFLIEQFADDAGKKGGEFFTPPMVRTLIVELLKPQEKMRICDPAAGSGGFLLESARYVKDHGGNSKDLSLFGQEKNVGTWAIAKINMLLHGLPDADIRKGDSIRDPKLLDQGRLMLFDRVMANPPFSLKDWGVESASKDSFNRFIFGIPPVTKGDYAFVEHMIATTNQKGMVGVVVPHGVLFRGGSEGEIRKNILEKDLIEAVIGLPSALFFGTGIGAAILVINKNKPAERRNKVLFINSSEEYQDNKKQNTLRPQDIKKVVEAFESFTDIERFAHVASMDEIRENECNLNITRYVDIAKVEEKIDVATVLKELKELRHNREESERKMYKYLEDLGYGSIR